MSTRIARNALPLWLALAAPAMASPARAQPAPAAQPDDAGPREEEARARFFRGLELFNDSQWGAALAEFERSRALFPTRAATRNAAICLKNLGRFDESFERYEAWIRAFPSAPPDERALVDDEMERLAVLVGALTVEGSEVGATVLVDGVERGRTPLAAPLRVAAGSHEVQVFKEGYLPARATVSVAGATNARQSFVLRPLAQSGRLRVNELSGRAASVLVDGFKVGPAPWEGALPPGDHLVVLAAEDPLGSQPLAAPVTAGEITSVTLRLEPLESSVLLSSEPAGALLLLDGARVGRGSFRGRVRAGRHKVAAALDGYLTREVALEVRAGEESAASLRLEPDRASPLWKQAEPPTFLTGATLAPLIGLGLGAVATRGCDERCAPTPSYGALALARAGYRFPIGLALEVEAGYAGLFQRVDDRPARLYERPLALRVDRGRVDTRLAIQSILAGGAVAADAAITPSGLRLRARVGGGFAVANVAEAQTGEFAAEGQPGYAVAAVGENHRALGGWVAPQVELFTKIGPVELGAGLSSLLFLGGEDVRWSNTNDVLAPAFLGFYDEAPIVGRSVLAIAPSFEVGGLF